MRIPGYGSALGLCAAAALLTGCGGSQSPIGAPGAMPQTPALAARSNSSSYKVLYSFGPAPDGNAPNASLVDVGGTLYGTTTGGGSNTCRGGYTYPYYFSCGTVFSITTDGTEKVLYSFGPTPDGNTPTASLLNVGDMTLPRLGDQRQVSGSE
jgi:hypothetical protein